MSRLIKIADWNGEKRGNVIFVHGLGGHPYSTWTDPSVDSFVRRIRQVVFIATPHTGSGKATFLSWLSWLAWPSASSRNLVANDPQLRDLNFGYRTLTEAPENSISHLIYFEMTNTL